MNTARLTSAPIDREGSDIVVTLAKVGKQYQLFDDPRDRLKHMLLERFGKSYGHTFWAVRNISFELRRGEMLALIGKNGSGKSTILQMIAGTLTSTEGTITCWGRVGALFEIGSGFNPDYTGRENIQLNASILGISSKKLKEKIESIIEFADIGDYIDQPVKFYSSGMFVRLAFAVTTGLDADILLIDEALAVGDIFFRQKCYQRLGELRKRGVSIILVTHSMGDVEQFCERAVLLDHGKELFQGAAPEAVKRYYLLEQQEHPAHENLSSSQDDLTPRVEFALLDQNEVFWPAPEAFFDNSHVSHVSNGWARCTGVALCDERGEPCRVFEQGQIASFFYEFELSHDIEVPIGGLQIQNDKGLVIHGKTTLEYGSEVPTFLQKGTKVRFHNMIHMDISIGEYTFEVGFSTISHVDYQHRQSLSHPDLYARLVRVCNLVGLGPFIVIFRKHGIPVQLMHHGLANLPGTSTVFVSNNSDRKEQLKTIR
jgi:ABC-type polysaccharide/polyol phosphate transport system ATPase subunit